MVTVADSNWKVLTSVTAAFTLHFQSFPGKDWYSTGNAIHKLTVFKYFWFLLPHRSWESLDFCINLLRFFLILSYLLVPPSAVVFPEASHFMLLICIKYLSCFVQGPTLVHSFSLRIGCNFCKQLPQFNAWVCWVAAANLTCESK